MTVSWVIAMAVALHKEIAPNDLSSALEKPDFSL